MVRVWFGATAVLMSLALAGCTQSLGGREQTAALSYGNASAGAEATEGLAGGAIGRSLDKEQLAAGREAEYRALEFGRTGIPVTWRGEGGVRGEVIPGASYRINSFDCRDFTHVLYSGARPVSARGTACRQPDGTWQPVV